MANLANRPIAKLKPSKLVILINNRLGDLFICQTFPTKHLKRVNSPQTFSAKLSHYMVVYSNVIIFLMFRDHSCILCAQNALHLFQHYSITNNTIITSLLLYPVKLHTSNHIILIIPAYYVCIYIVIPCMCVCVCVCVCLGVGQYQFYI